jgi:hypothetical protein
MAKCKPTVQKRGDARSYGYTPPSNCRFLREHSNTMSRKRLIQAAAHHQFSNALKFFNDPQKG